MLNPSRKKCLLCATADLLRCDRDVSRLSAIIGEELKNGYCVLDFKLLCHSLLFLYAPTSDLARA